MRKMVRETKTLFLLSIELCGAPGRAKPQPGARFSIYHRIGLNEKASLEASLEKRDLEPVLLELSFHRWYTIWEQVSPGNKKT
jgi:hypothetical protein